MEAKIAFAWRLCIHVQECCGVARFDAYARQGFAGRVMRNARGR